MSEKLQQALSFIESLEMDDMELETLKSSIYTSAEKDIEKLRKGPWDTQSDTSDLIGIHTNDCHRICHECGNPVDFCTCVVEGSYFNRFEL